MNHTCPAVADRNIEKRKKKKENRWNQFIDFT